MKPSVVSAGAGSSMVVFRSGQSGRARVRDSDQT